MSVRDLRFSIDEPVERGGTNTGPTPTDTALAALVACTNVIGHKCAKKHGVDIGNLTINARCEFDRRGVTLEEAIDVPFTKIDLQIQCNGEATQIQLDALAKEVAEYCPLSKLFRQAGTELNDEWKAKDPVET